MTWPEDIYDLRNASPESHYIIKVLPLAAPPIKNVVMLDLGECEFVIADENPYLWHRCGAPAKGDRCVKHPRQRMDDEVTKR